MWGFPLLKVPDGPCLRCHCERRCHSQLITSDSGSAAEKPFYLRETKSSGNRGSVRGQGAAHDMWICQMLPLWILLKYALTTAALSAWKELGDKRWFYWQCCSGLTRQPGSSSLTQHHNSLQMCQMLAFVWSWPLFHLTVSFLHAYWDRLFSRKLHHLPTCTLVY